MSLRRLIGIAAATAVSATVLTLSGAVPAVASTAPPGCPQVDGISVRGSEEPQDGSGGTIAGPLIQAVQQQSTQKVRFYDIVYPATLDNYNNSVAQGVTALQTRLRTVSDNCPNVKFVLAGYSQGAQVIANTLDAQPVRGGDFVKAVALFGDPTFNGREGYDFGSYDPKVNGIYARPKGALDTFAQRIRSYCRKDDTVCQAGATGDGHFKYAANRDNATDFVLSHIGG